MGAGTALLILPQITRNLDIGREPECGLCLAGGPITEWPTDGGSGRRNCVAGHPLSR